jgi:ATP-dependent DNA helicase PIF1
MEVATLYRLDNGAYRADVPLSAYPALLELDVQTTEADGVVSAEFGPELLSQIEAVLQNAACHIVHTYDAADDDDARDEPVVRPPETATPYDRAKRLARQGASFLLTGPGGTGKSYLLWEIVAEALCKGQKVTMSAMTGLAADTLRRGAPEHVLELLEASEIEAPPVTTFHTAFGAPDAVVKGLGKTTATHERLAQTWLRAIHNNEELAQQWAHDIHVVDEVSMMESELLDVWQSVMSQLDLERPPCVILAGDFCQLAPVNTRDRDRPAAYCFRALHWNKLIGNRVCVLNKNWRMQGDTAWQQLLDRLRLGQQTEADLTFLKSRSSAHHQPTAEHLRVFCVNRQVDEYNRARNEQLGSQGAARQAFKPSVTKVTLISNQSGRRVITANYTEFETAKRLVDRIVQHKAGLRNPETELYVGSRVMLTANTNVRARLVNGAQGTVVDFTDKGAVVDFDSIGQMEVAPRSFSDTTVPFADRARSKQDCYEATVLALPLVPAFAITTHKVQGTTLNKAYFNLTDGRRSTVFEPALVYVGLGRVRDAQSIIVDGIDQCWRRIDPPAEVQRFYSHAFSAARPTDSRPAAGVPQGRRDIHREEVPMTRPSMAIILKRAQRLRELHREQDRERIGRQLETQRRATADRLRALRARSTTGSPGTPGTPPSAQASGATTPVIDDANIL